MPRSTRASWGAHLLWSPRHGQVGDVDVGHLAQLVHPAAVHDELAVGVGARTAHAFAGLEGQQLGRPPGAVLHIEDAQGAAGRPAAPEHDELAAHLLVRRAPA